jgi:hypothetical protein
MLGHKNTEHHFSSGGNIEEVGHESNLSANVAFPDSFNLSLPDPVHDLILADGPPRRVETEEAGSGIDPAFYESGQSTIIDKRHPVFATQPSSEHVISGFPKLLKLKADEVLAKDRFWRRSGAPPAREDAGTPAQLINLTTRTKGTKDHFFDPLSLWFFA